MSNVPIWAEPAPGARKPRFTRAQIAAAAIAIADREGFAELSMRRIADALGAGTMTLYYYVRTKDDLVTLMADALMGEVMARSTPLPAAWRPALEKIAHASHTTFLAHPWAPASMEGARIGPAWLGHVEQSLSALARLAVSNAEKLALLAIVDDYVFGCVMRSVDELPTDAKTTKIMNDVTTAALATGAYPQLAALVGKREPMEAFVDFEAQMSSRERFVQGLQCLLDGFELRHGLHHGRARPDRAPRRRPARTRTKR